MEKMLLAGISAFVFTTIGASAAIAAPPHEDALAPWRTGVRVRAVSAAEKHSIHSYYVTCPESPNGKSILYYTSSTPEGEAGEIRLQDRATGDEVVLASQVTTEDAHRAACQQWAAGGRCVVYHDCRDGRWRVVAVDVATRRSKVLAEDRQLGFGTPASPWVPIYGKHWNPGPHTGLELVHVETGEIQKFATTAEVVEQYGDWVRKKFGTQEISIFFPVLSPDAKKVFFKLSRPGGGDDFRSSKASFREGKVVYDLAERRFVRLIESWGHPSWSPDSNGIFEKGNILFDLASGKSVRYSPSSPSDHPSLRFDGRIFTTDADVSRRDFGKPGDWAVMVGDTQADDFRVVHQFNNAGGAKSWRRSHPHPAFTPDGRRLYYNVSTGPWTKLFLAECNDASSGKQ